MTVSISDYCYGTQEFGETLQTIAEENDFTPIENMMEWSKNYYENYKVHFDENQFSITPGQAAVFYKEDFVLGGGIITKN